jgi:hypothetical protein
LKKVEKIFQLSLSKHDQVLLPTQTRAGRVKIPSCIACDRPLLEKVRQDLVSRSEIVERGVIKPFGSLTLPMEGAPMKSASRSFEDGSIYGEADSLMSLSLDGGLHTHAGKMGRGSTPGTKRNVAPNVESAYVLKGGFKLPLKKQAINAKFTDDNYLFSPPRLSEDGSVDSGEFNLNGGGAASYLQYPEMKYSRSNNKL